MISPARTAPTATMETVAVLSSADRVRWCPVYWTTCTLAVITVLVFWRALGGEILLWDDNINLLVTPSVREINGETLQWMFTDTAQVLRYKPLSWLTWAALHEVFGVGTAPYQTVNVILHACNAAMLGLLLFLIVRRGKSVSPSRALVAAFCAAAFWAWHPMRIEPVAWISGLGYPLAFFFSLISLLALFRASARNETSFLWMSLSITTWGLSLLSYPSSLCLLPAFPLAILVGMNAQRRRAALLRIAPHVLLGVALAVVTVITRIYNPGTWNPAGATEGGLAGQLARAGTFWLWSLARVLPWGEVTALHDGLMFPTLRDLPAVAGLTLILAISIGVWWLRSRSWAPLLCWMAFLVAMVPHMMLTEAEFLPTERGTYSPSFFVAGLMAWGLSSVRPTQRWLVPVTIALAMIAGWTAYQANLWHENLRFFQHLYTTASTEYRPMVAGRLGIALVKARLPFEAIPYMQEGLTGGVDSELLRFTLAQAHSATGDPKRAVEHYRWLLNRFPGDTAITTGLGKALLQLGQRSEAISLLRSVHALDPSPANTTDLATALAADGAEPEALALLTNEIQQAWPPAASLARSLKAGRTEVLE